MKSYLYTKSKSDIFGEVYRPIVTVKIFSKTKNIWIPIYDTLADTGADITLIPAFVGKLIVEDITTGREIKLRGVVPYSKLVAYIHTLKLFVAGREIETSVAISESDKTLPILGRVKGLDLFNVSFVKGEQIIFDD